MTLICSGQVRVPSDCRRNCGGEVATRVKFKISTRPKKEWFGIDKIIGKKCLIAFLSTMKDVGATVGDASDEK